MGEEQEGDKVALIGSYPQSTFYYLFILLQAVTA